MDMIDFETLSLKLRFNPLMLEEIDGTSLNLYFYNIDESWTEEYTVNVNIIRISD